MSTSPRPGEPAGGRAAVGLLVALGVVLAVDLVAGLAELAWLEWLAKPLLVPIIAAWVLVVASRPLSTPVRRLLVGLGFGWLGDVLLLPSGDGWFLAGLLAFLAMQVAYLAAFRSVPGPGLLRRRPWLALPYVVVWLAMNAWLHRGVAELFVPVLVYSAVLLAMAAVALDRSLLLPRPHGTQLAVGGALFVVSDGLIAAVAFDGIGNSGLTSVIVMATYVGAQLLIAAGVTLGTAERR